MVSRHKTGFKLLPQKKILNKPSTTQCFLFWPIFQSQTSPKLGPFTNEVCKIFGILGFSHRSHNNTTCFFLVHLQPPVDIVCECFLHPNAFSVQVVSEHIFPLPPSYFVPRLPRGFSTRRPDVPLAPQFLTSSWA